MAGGAGRGCGAGHAVRAGTITSGAGAPSKLDDVGAEPLLVVSTTRDLALRRAMLPQNTTSEPFRDLKLLSDMLNAATPAGGAQ